MHAKSPVVQRNPDGVLQSVHILVSALRTGSVTNSLCKHVPGRQAMWNPLSLRSGAGLPAPSLSLFWPESPSLRSWGSLLHVLWGWIFLELLAAVTSADSLPWSLSKIFVDTSFLCMTSFNFKNSVFYGKYVNHIAMDYVKSESLSRHLRFSLPLQRRCWGKPP